SSSASPPRAERPCHEPARGARAPARRRRGRSPPVGRDESARRPAPRPLHRPLTRENPMTVHSTRRHLLGALGASGLVLGAAACGSSAPFADGDSGAGGGGSDGGGGASGGTIAVGSQAYYSNEIIAELFAQVLEKAGFTVDRQFQIGQREVYMPELESGALDLLPEYLGNLLQHYEPDAGSASPEEISDSLAEALPEQLRVLAFAEASDQDSYTTTSSFAAENSLTAIGDLAGVDEDLKIAANSEFEKRPYGPEGAKAVY